MTLKGLEHDQRSNSSRPQLWTAWLHWLRVRGEWGPETQKPDVRDRSICLMTCLCYSVVTLHSLADLIANKLTE